MSDINPRAGEYAEIRQGVRDVCAPFDSAYWQSVERSSAYPEAFVAALTAAGWLAALIPAEFGGGGHRNASGVVVASPIDQAVAAILPKARALIA